MDCFATLAMTVVTPLYRRLDLHHDLARRHLLALGDIDGEHLAGNACGMHMFHLHRFQRHHGLAGGDLLAGLDQHGDDTAVHRRAHLAIAAAGRSRYRCGEREIADRKRASTMQEIEPVSVAQEFDGFSKTVAAETESMAADPMD